MISGRLAERVVALQPFPPAGRSSNVCVTFTDAPRMRRSLPRWVPALLLALPCSLLAQSDPTRGAFVLHPGDAVRITVWRQPELSGEFLVGQDGSIMHPLYRKLNVGGLPLIELEARVRTFLTQFGAQPDFVVEPLLRVAVGGEVDRPNLYSLSPGTTVSQAVAMAGGLTERGRADRIRLFRGGQLVYVDLTRAERGTASVPVESGDEIYVERRRAVFREYIIPVMSVLGATAAIVNVLTRDR